MKEIELKFINVNIEEIKNKLINIGAELKFDKIMEGYTFKKEGFSENNSNEKYLRVRKVNGKIEVTYKGPAENSKMTSREEIEFLANDFETVIIFLEKLGFKKGKYFKKHRIHYELGNVHFEIDTPLNIPTYLEIETRNEEDMINICKKSDIDINQGEKGMIQEVLKRINNK